MRYSVKDIEFYVRETKPARFASALGKAAQAGAPKEHPRSPLCHARMTIEDDQGNAAFGCAADRLSVRWLDKRAGRSTSLKRRELVALLRQAAAVYQDSPQFETPFGQWLHCHPIVMRLGQAAGQEDLTSSFASALLERAMIDAVCRLDNRSLFEMLREDRLGFRPAAAHPELGDFSFARMMPQLPRTSIYVRHTVGFFDPLTDDDWPRQRRLDDGLPETLLDYIEREGIRYFKIKISGNTESRSRSPETPLGDNSDRVDSGFDTGRQRSL